MTDARFPLRPATVTDGAAATAATTATRADHDQLKLSRIEYQRH